VRNAVVIGLTSLFLVSCVAIPERLESAAVASFADDKLARVTANQAPILRPITLYDAMARAIKYNLDFRVELYNELLESKQLKNANLDMLPTLIANSNYSGRDNYAGGTTALLRSDRERFDSNIALSWNILDFGLSYVRAKQAADKVLIAEERRRKIINRVIENVRTAYWRAVSADRLIVGLQRLVVRVRRAIKDSEALQRDGVSSPLTALTYQRELVEIQQRIQSLQSDLVVAKTQLSALMNIAPGQKYKLATKNLRIGLTQLRLNADEMVYTAMENRPEIRDVQYNKRINQKEAKVALLELLPSANIFAGGNIDSDSFLLNANWVSWGAKATWNLMKVFKYPARKRLVEAKDQLLDTRALAITMAIMTQVHVSRARFINSRKLYFTAAKHLKIQSGILRQIRESAAADQASEQTLIREEMNTLVSRVKRDVAYADLQNSYANIYSAMGLDPYTAKSIASDDLSTISSMLKDMWIERGVRAGTLLVKNRPNKRDKFGASSYGADKAPRKVLKNTKLAAAKPERKLLDQSRFGNNAQFTENSGRQNYAEDTMSKNSQKRKVISGVARQPDKPDLNALNSGYASPIVKKTRLNKPRIKKPVRLEPVVVKKSVQMDSGSKPLSMLRANAWN